MTNINGSNQLYQLPQRKVIYGQGLPGVYQIEGLLAPVVTVITPNNYPTYNTGRVLSQYNTLPPDPQLAKFLVNYDPASTSAGSIDQRTPTHILSSEFIYNQAGVDLTNITATYQKVEALPLTIGTKFIDYWVINDNDPTVWANFQTKFKLTLLQPIDYDGLNANLYQINGVN